MDPLSVFAGEAPPACSGPVSAAVQAEGCGPRAGPTPGQGQRELFGGDSKAQVSAEHQERADRHPPTGAQGKQTGSSQSTAALYICIK